MPFAYASDPSSSRRFCSSSSSSSSSSLPPSPFRPSSESLKKQKNEFVTLQANVSQTLLLENSNDNNNNNNNNNKNNAEEKEDREQELFHKHVAETYDNLAEFFAQKSNIPEELVAVYQTTADKIIQNLIEEREIKKKKEESNSTLRFRILDVASGTGSLWPFLLEQAERRRNVRLHIDAIDLSPGMVQHGQAHARTLLTQYPNHVITVSVANVLDYTAAAVVGWSSNSAAADDDNKENTSSGSSSSSSTLFDGIVCNACWGNFYDPSAVLRRLAGLLESHNSNAAGCFGTLFVTHPLGADFVKQLNQCDPSVVPHVLPKSWNHLLIGLPLTVQAFEQELTITTTGNNTSSNSRSCISNETISTAAETTTTTTATTTTTNNNSVVHMPFYFAALKRQRYSLLPQIQRFRGPVATGYGRGGKKLGFPTANLESNSTLLRTALEHVDAGVYIGWARVEPSDMVHKAVVNVGYSPTFQGQENKEKIIEAHLMPSTTTLLSDAEDSSSSPLLKDFYGKIMRLELLAYLRHEQKFGSFPELIAQITADAVDAKMALDSDPVLAKARHNSFFFTTTTTTTPTGAGNSNITTTTTNSTDDGSSNCCSVERKEMKEYLQEILLYEPF